MILSPTEGPPSEGPGPLPRDSCETASMSWATTAPPPGPPGASPPPDEPLPAAPGYELLGVLGRGGMGVVYLARQLSPNRLVALKMLKNGSLASPEELRRFRLEAEELGRLQHANI